MFPNKEQAFITREWLKDEFLKISYSQHGEDDYIREFFWRDILARKEGYYLDIGCYDDCIFSNTKLLSLIGWKGVAVDANPDLIKPWLKARPKDTFIHRCLCTSDKPDGYVDFYRFEEYRQNSTVNKKYAEDLIKNGVILKDKISVLCINLINLAKNLTKLNYFPKGLDFLSIDLEYIDYLNDLPVVLKILQPKLICFEKADPNTNISNLMESREVKSIQKSNYIPIGITGMHGVNIIAASANYI